MSEWMLLAVFIVGFIVGVVVSGTIMAQDRGSEGYQPLGYRGDGSPQEKP
jgi:hypothetical protein